VTWGKRRAFEEGRFSMPYKQFLGYEKGEDGQPVIVPEEAEIVRLIYRLFLYGKSASFIASLLTDEGIPTPGGKKTWRSNVVISILQNEKYAGNAMLQKGFTTDFLTKKTKINEGELPQFFIEGSHPAIVEPALFDLVQAEFQRREASGQVTVSTHPLSGKIFCGDCGALFGPRVQHSTSKYRRVIWQCNKKYARGQKGVKCPSTSVKEEQVQAAFLTAFNRQLDNRAEIFAAYDEILQTLTDTTALDSEAAALKQECEVVAELTRKAVEENARVAQNQDEYNMRHGALVERYNTATARLEEIQKERSNRRIKHVNITRFLSTLKQQDEIVTEFDEELWYITVDRVTVHDDGRLAVAFRDGAVVEILSEKR